MDYREFLRRFGKAVKRRREETKSTQTTLALELDTDQGNVSRLEGGKQGFDSTMLFKLASALEMPLSELFQEIEQAGGVHLFRECLTAQERELLLLFRSANEEGKKLFLMTGSAIAMANPNGDNVVQLISTKKAQ